MATKFFGLSAVLSFAVCFWGFADLIFAVIFYVIAGVCGLLGQSGMEFLALTQADIFLDSVQPLNRAYIVGGIVFVLISFLGWLASDERRFRRRMNAPWDDK